MGEELKGSGGRLRKEIEEQGLGTHLCCIYRDGKEQLSALSIFMLLGVERNEKCLYIVDDRTRDEVIDAFENMGFDLEEYMESGQFEFLTKSESYLKDGYFDPDKMIGLLEESKEEALEEGYNGLRVTGEMTWFFSDMPGVGKLMKYESKLNEFLPDNKVIALCQYNEERFSAEVLVDVLRTHPRVLIYDDLHENPYYMPPRIFVAQMDGKVTWEHYASMKEDIIQRTRLRREGERSEEELRKSEREKSLILESAPILIVYQNLEHDITWANKQAGESVGGDPSDLVGRKCYEIWHNRENPCEDCPVEKSLETGGIERGTIKSLDGRYWLITGNPVENEKGETIGVIENTLEITDRKKAEEKHRESRERFERAIEEAPFPAVLHAGDGEVVKINEVWSDITGYAIEDIPTISDWAQKAYGEEKEEMEEVIDRLHEEEGRFSEGESEIKTKDGERRIWDFKATNLGELPDGRSLVLSMAQDITERKEAEERFKKLFDAGPDPMYFIDTDGVFREVNQAAIDVLGYERGEIIGKSVTEVSFFPPKIKEKIVEEFEKRLQGEDIPSYTIEAETKTGDRLFAELNSALIEERGKPVGVIGIARNVTRQKRLRDRKDFLTTLLRQDLGSKYRTIQGYLQLLKEEADLSGEHRGYLEKSMEAGGEADEILGLAKKLEEIEGTEWSGEKDVVKVMEHVIDSVSDLVEGEGVEVEEDYPESIGKVKGDYSLNTLFTQLLVTRIQLGECNKIRISADEREENILLKMKDDGERLSENVKNLFAGDVYRGDTTGVGGVRYYMIRQLAEHNNAEIEVKDSELGGARFDVYMKQA